MKKKWFSTFLLLGVTSIGMAQEKINVVLLLVDDMGWSDLGCYAQDDFHETPNIDKLAEKGMKFTNGYASCAVSSPTRASIMTGQYPARLRITDWIPGHSTGNEYVICPKMYYELPKDRITIAQALKCQGYKTLHVGKWHLGEREEYWPDSYGFDVNIGGHSKGAPGSYYYPFAKTGGNIDWTNLNLPEGAVDGDYLTDILTDHAISEIDKAVREDKPFFLNMSYYQVHVPSEGKPEYVEKYRSKLANGNYQGVKNLNYAAMIQSLDESVGRIMKKLEELGIEERTLVILTSDNGGLAGKEYNGNAPLRAGKGTYYEGGIREPYIFYWPKHIAPGKVSDELIVSTDIYSTILDVADATSYGNKITDGISLLPYVTGKQNTINRNTIYWHYPHFHVGPPVSVIRKGDYKLIEFLVDGKLELYNVKEDIGENENLVLALPSKVKEMQEQLHAWKKNVNADELIYRKPETEKYVRKGSGWLGANNIKNPPVFEIDSNKQVLIYTFSEGEIRYTLDGSEPNRKSTKYIEPIDLKHGGIVKAKVWSSYKGEEVESETYTFRVPLSDVKLISISSEHKNYPASHVLDEKESTYWQSDKGFPQFVVFDLGRKRMLSSIVYQPARRLKTGVIYYRTMSENRKGAVSRYRIETGDDLEHMKTIKEGFFNYNRYAFLDEQVVEFDQQLFGRYVRFVMLNSIDGTANVNMERMDFIPVDSHSIEGSSK